MTIPPTVCDCGHNLLPVGVISIWSDGINHTETACIPTPIGAAS